MHKLMCTAEIQCIPSLKVSLRIVHDMTEVPNNVLTLPP